MGRRQRARAAADPLAPPPAATQTARVRVSDELWRDFRQAIGDRHVSEALADCVEQEVARWHAARLRNAENLTADEIQAALRRIGELEKSLERLTVRLSRAARPVHREPTPGPWDQW